MKFKDKGKFGDPHFGGEDFDNALVDYCINKFYEMKKIKIDKSEPEIMKRLKMSCENAKKLLSIKESTQIELNDLKDNEDLSLEITRDLFEEICGFLFDKCISPIYDLLNNIGLCPSEIDDIVLIGGSTKIPKIKKMIRCIFDKEPYTNINPDEAVASGAAILAAKLSGSENKDIENILIKDITPFTLGIAVFDHDVLPFIGFIQFLSNLEKIEPKDKKNKNNFMEMLNQGNGKFMSSIIKKGSPIPFENTQQYFTVYDNQESVRIEVYEGEHFFVNENNLLGQFFIKNLPKKKAGEVKFDVSFKIDANGILTVTSELCENKDNKEKLVVETYKGGISKYDYNIIEKISQSDPKDNKFYKMRDLKIEMDNYYNKIINLEKKEDDDEDDDDDEEIKEERNFNIICNYSRSIEEFISLFEQKELKNEAILEKIFFYLEKLFKSYVMALKIKNQVTKEFQQNLINKVMDYFCKFFELKIFGLLGLLDILKDAPIKFFFDSAVNLMQLFMIKAQLYQNELKEENFNKYYAKKYYKGALDICEKYKLDKKKDRIDREKQKGYEEIKNKCLSGINNLNSEYFIEIDKKLSKDKLISNDLINNKETLYLTLDAFHQNISTLQDFDDIESKTKIAFCYANIIKIDYKLIGNYKNLRTLSNYANKCIEISEEIEFIKKKEWFKEFLKLKKEIEQKIKKEEENDNYDKKRIKENMKDTLNQISKKAKDLEHCDFIKYIIENYPPIGYKKENNYVKRFKDDPDKTLEELTTVYHTSNYHGKDITYERYLIIEQIETELNKIKFLKNQPVNNINSK